MFKLFTKELGEIAMAKISSSVEQRGLQYYLQEVKAPEQTNAAGQKIFKLSTDTNEIADLEKVREPLEKNNFFTKLYTEGKDHFLLASRQKDEQAIKDCVTSVNDAPTSRKL